MTGGLSSNGPTDSSSGSFWIPGAELPRSFGQITSAERGQYKRPLNTGRQSEHSETSSFLHRCSSPKPSYLPPNTGCERLFGDSFSCSLLQGMVSSALKSPLGTMLPRFDLELESRATAILGDPRNKCIATSNKGHRY